MPDAKSFNVEITTVTRLRMKIRIEWQWENIPGTLSGGEDIQLAGGFSALNHPSRYGHRELAGDKICLMWS